MSAKLEYLQYLRRNPEKYATLYLVIQGKIKGERSMGRKRISWFKNLKHDLEKQASIYSEQQQTKS